MNEFSKLFAEQLHTPERCQECPIAEDMRDRLEMQLRDIEQLSRRELFASPKTVRRAVLARNGITDPILQESQRSVEAAFNAREGFAHKCQLELARIASNCAGPATLKETMPLGNTVSVTVCGSAALEACSIDEPVRVERHEPVMPPESH